MKRMIGAVCLAVVFAVLPYLVASPQASSLCRINSVTSNGLTVHVNYTYYNDSNQARTFGFTWGDGATGGDVGTAEPFYGADGDYEHTYAQSGTYSISFYLTNQCTVFTSATV